MSHGHLSSGNKPRLCCFCHKTGPRTPAGKNRYGHDLFAHRRCIEKDNAEQQHAANQRANRSV